MGDIEVSWCPSFFLFWGYDTISLLAYLTVVFEIWEFCGCSVVFGCEFWRKFVFFFLYSWLWVGFLNTYISFRLNLISSSESS